MCAQCVASGAAYIVPTVVALRVWGRRGTRPATAQADAPEPQHQPT